MKKYAAFLMFLALLLTCACSQKPAEKPAPDVPPVQEQPQTPEPIAPAPQPERPAAPQTPETPPAPVMPEVPVTPVQPEEPQAPQTPVQPEVVEPEGAAIRVKLPAEIEGSSGADCIVPLEGGIVALRSFDGSGRTELVIYDLENNAVLSRESIPGHDGTNELILMDTDPYALRYYDGRDYWEITLDEAWQQSREEFDLALYLSVMGGLMVHQKSDGSISVGRVVSPGLKANDRMGYHLVRILNDHQLLYQAVDKTVSSLSHYGVYDSETDETRAVTTMGQVVLGSWGDVLLIGRTDNGWSYDFGWIDVTDYTYTPLEIGHETAETGINADHYGSTDYIQCDPESRSLLLVGDKDGVRTVQVVDIQQSEELYRWESPTGEDYRFALAADGGLVVYRGSVADRCLWLVEYPQPSAQVGGINE